MSWLEVKKNWEVTEEVTTKCNSFEMQSMFVVLLILGTRVLDSHGANTTQTATQFGKGKIKLST